MTTEEMLNSDDIEVAELGVKLLLEQGKDLNDIDDDLQKKGKYIVVYRSDKFERLTPNFHNLSSSHLFLKDPTRTTLIDLK